MRRILEVSESGYYSWQKNRDKQTKRQLLSVEIQKILDGRPDNDNYGVNRIRLAFKQKGIKASQRTVYRAMAEHGRLHVRRRVSRGITKSSPEVQERENLLKGDFQSSEPMRKFIADITEIR